MSGPCLQHLAGRQPSSTRTTYTPGFTGTHLLFPCRCPSDQILHMREIFLSKAGINPYALRSSLRPPSLSKSDDGTSAGRGRREGSKVRANSTQPVISLIERTLRS